MKQQAGWLMVAMGVLALAVAGCNPQQQAQANDAAARAKVQAQHALTGANKALSNDAITLRVKGAFANSNGLNASNIKVVTEQQHVVYLKGTVPTADQKTLAERIAKDTVGPNTQVVNQLIVGK